MVKKILLFTLIALTLNAQSKMIHHNIVTEIIPSESFMKVTDEITIPNEQIVEAMKFKLNSSLTIEANEFVNKLSENINAEDIGMDKDDSESESKLFVNIYEINIPTNTDDDFTLKIIYSGKIESPVVQSEENYARGFSESPGIIWEKGVYLAGSTYWVPYFDEGMVTFNLTTKSPKEWKTVSVGKKGWNIVKDGFMYLSLLVSIVIFTSSPTPGKPYIIPKSERLIAPVAENPATCFCVNGFLPI